MRKLAMLAALALATCSATPALAQTTPAISGDAVQGAPAILPATSSASGRQVKQQVTVQLCSSGGNYVVCPATTAGQQTSANSTSVAPASDATFPVAGNVAHGATEAGNPVGVGGTAFPQSTATGSTVSDGQRTRFRATNYGWQYVVGTYRNNAGDGSANGETAYTVTADGTQSALLSRSQVFNGTTWDRQRGDTTGTFTVTTPTAAATNAIVPVVGSLVSSIAAKASAGNLYSVEATTGASALYLYVFNATAAPSDGAVTAGTASGNYQFCRAIAATTSAAFSYDIPERYSVGITPVLSSTACGTLTKATTAVFVKARVQ